MSLKDELDNYVSATFTKPWNIEDGDHVPSSDDKLALGNKAISIEAAVLYADLSESTRLVANKTAQFAAEIYKAYVYAAAKSIRFLGGSVTAYDGDRVMGVFMGGQRRNDAANAAFLLNAIVEDMIIPAYKNFYTNTDYKLQHKVGIDDSPLLVTNTGIRGNNDYVWVGTAANNAAKMAALDLGHTTYVSETVRNVMNENNTITVDGTNIWSDLGAGALGYRIYGASAKRVSIPD